MHKKGGLGDQVSIVYFIFLFVIIGIGLTWGAYSYFGGGYDVREIQAKWLSGVIENCLESKKINFEDRNDFFKVCNLNGRVLNENGFIVRLCEGSCYEKGKVLFYINSNYELCGFKETRSINYPKCSEKEIELNGIKSHLIVGSKINPRRSG